MRLKGVFTPKCTASEPMKEVSNKTRFSVLSSHSTLFFCLSGLMRSILVPSQQEIRIAARLLQTQYKEDLPARVASG